MITINLCKCGAYTVSYGRESVSMTSDTFKKLFGHSLLKEASQAEWCSCDHCVNHWGIDICACGSGELPDDCLSNFKDCGKPYQYLSDSLKTAVLLEAMKTIIH